MNRSPAILAGIILVVVASMFGLVVLPDWQLGGLEPAVLQASDGTRSLYPTPLDEWRERPGRELYVSLGCMYCHSQQVRPEGYGSDLDRGWGARRSVPLDYILQSPPLLGTMRTGPDLSNIGRRQPSLQWHYLHLYEPRLVSPGSNMAPFPFLFDVTEREPASEAYRVPGREQWIVPRPEARALVAYLLALEQPYSLEELQ